MQPSWLKEFKAEIEDDRRMLADVKHRRAGSQWSHTKALERTQAFYRQRISSFAECGTITVKQKDQLLAMVDGMGRTLVDL